MQNAPAISQRKLTDSRKVGAAKPSFAIRRTDATLRNGSRKRMRRLLRGGDTTVVMLIPARTDTAYFHDYIYKKHAVRFIRGRLHFNESKSAAPFPSMVVIMRPSDTGGAIMDKQAGKIYYVCDRKKCAPCDPDCKHTSDITHAKNFTPADINGKYPVKAGGAEIFIERIDEIPLLPENETITTIGVDPDFSTDKFVATIEKTITDARAANRQNDCPFQIQDGDEWFCGKITDARVVCPDMADFKACGGYPYKKLKEFCEELNRKATKIIEQYRGEK